MSSVECVSVLKIVYRNRVDAHYVTSSDIFRVKESFERWVNKSYNVEPLVNFDAVNQENGISGDLFATHSVLVKLSYVMSIYSTPVDSDVKKRHAILIAQQKILDNDLSDHEKIIAVISRAL